MWLVYHSLIVDVMLAAYSNNNVINSSILHRERLNKKLKYLLFSSEVTRFLQC